MRPRDPQKERAIRSQALALIVREGFDGFSMQKLAKAARVSPATLYIYFENRDDLILALYHEAMERMSEATLRDFDPDASFEEGLRVQWRNRARFCLEQPLAAHFLEQIRYSPFHDRALKGGGGNFVKAMNAFVKNAIRRKQLVPVPLEVYWSIAFSPLYQLMKMHMQGRGLPGTGPFVLDESTLELTLSLVLKALRPESAAS